MALPDPQQPLEVDPPPSPVTAREPWASKRRLASHLGCSTKTVERYMKAGMPHAKPLDNGPVRFKVSECERWLESWRHGDRQTGPRAGDAESDELAEEVLRELRELRAVVDGIALRLDRLGAALSGR